MKVFYIMAFAVFLVLASCSKSLEPLQVNTVKMKIDSSIKIIELPEDKLPYNWYYTYNLNDPILTDTAGIVMFKYLDTNYYHPVVMAVYLLWILDSYLKTSNPAYLEKACHYADKFQELSYRERGSYYFPYDFDWELHVVGGDKLYAPWFSGMAQGQVLSGIVRLALYSGEEKYYRFADSIFTSFKNFEEDGDPWTVTLDDDGYYWIEEYPLPEPTHVLNGFIFGVYALYDYYQMTKSDESLKYLRASLTTLKHFVPFYRRPGMRSLYCLKHHHPASVKYHKIHIEQLNMIYKMTGDMFFKSMADSFYADYHE